jgi:hypothetical protein
MLHPTMLDDVGLTCWLRLNKPLSNIIQHNVQTRPTCCITKTAQKYLHLMKGIKHDHDDTTTMVSFAT